MPGLSESEIEKIADVLAEKMYQKAMDRFYQDLGKSVFSIIMKYVMLAALSAAAAYAATKR